MADTRAFGLISRKPRWWPTWKGWLGICICAMAIMGWGLTRWLPFLATTAPVRGDILVVEGWLPDAALQQAVREFRTHPYRLLVTTGGPLAQGSYLVRYKSYAQLAASTLANLGVHARHIAAVPAPWVRKDRTYASALALRRWIRAQGMSVHALNLLTLGPHARRSRMIFEKALGPAIRVGVIAVKDDAYDTECWWTSSAGVRTVIGESIAYIYARIWVSYRGG